MYLSFAPLAAIGAVMFFNAGLAAQTAPREPAPSAKPDSATQASPATHAQSAGEVTDPVADPKALVTLGHARFTVLTPELIRMEWAADGKFEDHASFVFLNRRLPVPKFETTVSVDGQNAVHTIKTGILTSLIPIPATAVSLPAISKSNSPSMASR